MPRFVQEYELGEGLAAVVLAGYQGETDGTGGHMTETYTFPNTAASLPLVVLKTRSLRAAGWKTWLVERTVKTHGVLTLVARLRRPSRSVRLAGFGNTAR